MIFDRITVLGWCGMFGISHGKATSEEFCSNQNGIVKTRDKRGNPHFDIQSIAADSPIALMKFRFVRKTSFQGASIRQALQALILVLSTYSGSHHFLPSTGHYFRR